jgi:hypothetical protein
MIIAALRCIKPDCDVIRNRRVFECGSHPNIAPMRCAVAAGHQTSGAEFSGTASRYIPAFVVCCEDLPQAAPGFRQHDRRAVASAVGCRNAFAVGDRDAFSETGM